MISTVLSTAPLLAALAWVVALIVEPGAGAPAAAFLVGAGLLLPALVGMVGMIFTGGRWAWMLSLSVAAGTLGPAWLLPIGPVWVVALAATTVATAALLSPQLRSGIRRLPSAAGPPARSVATPLLLLLTPLLLGLAGWEVSGAGEIVLGLTAPLAALWYARVLPAGLLAVRVLWPVLSLAMLPALHLATAVTTVVVALGVAVLAWHPTVRVAFHPPQERGTSYPIPPELAPPDVLDRAGIDEKGRRRR